MFTNQCNVELFSNWLTAISTSLHQIFAVTIAWLVIRQFKGFPRSKKYAKSQLNYRLIMILVFGLFAIYSIYSSITIETMDSCKLTLPKYLFKYLPSIDLRDTWTLLAGLTGGLSVGLSVALVAGIGCYLDGGFAEEGIALAAVAIAFGLYAGAIQHFRPHLIKTAPRLLIVIIAGACLKYIILLLMTASPGYAETIFLTTILNIVACMLFIWLISNFDHDSPEQLLQQSELRTLRAQIEPHFLKNILTDLTEIIETDQKKAVHYVCKLADYYNHTSKFAMLNTISLELELAQLQRFIALQSLGFGNRLEIRIADIPDELLSTEVLSGCLLTMVENSLKHAFKGRSPPFKVFVCVETQASVLKLRVWDNGHGSAVNCLTQPKRN